MPGPAADAGARVRNTDSPGLLPGRRARRSPVPKSRHDRHGDRGRDHADPTAAVSAIPGRSRPWARIVTVTATGREGVTRAATRDTTRCRWYPDPCRAGAG